MVISKSQIFQVAENGATSFFEATPISNNVQPKVGHVVNTSSPADSKGVFAMAMSNGNGKVLFAGVADAESFKATYDYFTKSLMMLAEAVNNRTRERNYFKKYVELLLGDITEEEFDKEIDENEPMYVVQPHIDVTRNDIYLATYLAENANLMDVDSIDDVADLFSFKYQSVVKELRAIQ